MEKARNQEKFPQSLIYKKELLSKSIPDKKGFLGPFLLYVTESRDNAKQKTRD